MNWKKLLDYKCPKCGDDLITNSSGSRRLIGCENEDLCGFVITKERFDSLVQDIYNKKNGKEYRPQFGDDPKNLEYLNNFDQKISDEEINE
jgi:ssDNA-binding Zn-finger/Zn-ribbon topoisomerase 1